MVTSNELRFDEQVAVISGAGGGLGKQYALLLASRGARIVVNDIGGSVTGDGANIEAANAVAEEIRQRDGEAVADSHSVTTPEGGQAIIDTALRTWGRVDIVINNAGIVRDAPFEDITVHRTAFLTTGIAPFPERSTRWALDTSRDSSSAGRRGSTVRTVDRGGA